MHDKQHQPFEYFEKHNKNAHQPLKWKPTTTEMSNGKEILQHSVNGRSVGRKRAGIKKMGTLIDEKNGFQERGNRTKSNDSVT